MSEKCLYCGKVVQNTRALGSHIHYVHAAESWTYISQNRSENEKGRFRKLLDSCLSQRGLRKPHRVDKLERPGFAKITFGGAEGTRTPDLLRAREALSQLSYSPIYQNYYKQ